MRPFVRAFLLTAGLAAMVATSPPSRPFEEFSLLPGELVVLRLNVHPESALPTPPDVQVSATPVPAEAQPSRLVGFHTSSGPPLREELAAVDVNASFTVGQDAGPLGTVAFVLDVPTDTRFGGKTGVPLLPEPGTGWLTLLAQGTAQAIHGEVRIDVESIEKACDCDVAAEASLDQFLRASDGGAP